MATAVVSGKPEVGVAIKNPDVERSPGPWCFSPLCHRCGLRCCSEGSLRVLVNWGGMRLLDKRPKAKMEASSKPSMPFIQSVSVGQGCKGLAIHQLLSNLQLNVFALVQS
jgi:hypothetical protein